MVRGASQLLSRPIAKRSRIYASPAAAIVYDDTAIVNYLGTLCISALVIPSQPTILQESLDLGTKEGMKPFTICDKLSGQSGPFLFSR